jgi:hypothetical protein
MKGATHNLRGGQGGDGMKTDNGDYLINLLMIIIIIIIITIKH